jgi:Zn-dependent M32 family carboxypeptidase
LQGTFSIVKHKELNQKIVQQIGFKLETGRITVSVHHFTESSPPSDVRITSRFREDDWYQGLARAIYEQNLNSSALSIDIALSMWGHTRITIPLSGTSHWSQQTQFWKWVTPMLQEAF